MKEIKQRKERRFLKTLGRVGEILVEQVLLKLGSSIIKKIGGKKTLPSILFLFLSLSLFAQFPNTGNKQRLGFQTTGDGLVWRGALSDTASIQPINNQSAWVILDTINLKFYTFDFTSNVWNLVGGAAFTQPVDSLFFNVGVPTNNVDTAKMRWDSDLATVVLGLNDNVPNELGFKNFWLVKNQTGSTIEKGSLVYANGTVGASGRITVAKFIANGSIDAKYLLGITAHDLTDGEDGYVISFGKIRQVNTDTFTAGAILYPSPTVAGVWTDVEPIAPNIDIPIGFCINSSSNNGTIAIRVASGYKLSELHDVSISSPVEKSSLYYSGGLWRDTTAALLVSDTASMLANYATKAYADTTGRLYARQDFTNVSSSTLTWTQSDTLIPGGVNVVQVYRNGQILLPSQYTIPTSTSVVIAASSFKVNDNYTVIFPRGGGAGSGGGSGSLTSISAGTGILVSPNPITTTGTVSADLSVLMELTDTSLLNLTSRFATKLNISDTAAMLSNYNTRINSKLNISDTASMLTPYFRDTDTTSLNLTSRFALKLNAADTASLSNRINAKGTGTVTSVATGYGLTGGTITSTGTLLLDSAVVFSRIRDSIVDVAIGNDTIKILKQEYAPATTSVLTWTVTSKFPIQSKSFILVFRNGQLLINDQYNLTDTNKITIVSNSFKVGANYTVVTVSGIGSVGTGVFPNPVYPEAGIAVSTGTSWTTSIPNNSTNWNIAFNDKINNASFSGTTTKTLTLTQYDGGTLTAPFTDLQGIVAADTASMLTNYLRTGVAASTYLPLTGGTLSGTLNRQEGSHDGSASTFYYNILNYFARQDNIKINPTAQITFTDRPGTLTFEKVVRTSDIHLMTARSFNGTSLGQYLDTTLSVVANQDGGRIGISKLNPNYKLDVNGTFNASGNSLIGGTLGVTGATTLTGGINGNIKTNGVAGPTSTPDNIWLGNSYSNGTTRDKLKIYLYNDNTEKYGFSVGSVGDVQYHSNSFHDFYIANTKKFFISNTNTTTDNIFTVNNAAVFNEGSADADFRVESDGNANMVFVDASTDRVGIGTNAPTRTLEVNGTVNATGDITENGLNVLTSADTVSLSNRINLKFNSSGGTISGFTNINATLNVVNDGAVGGTFQVGGITQLSNLAGTGTRMVVANSTGILSTQSVTERFYFDLGVVAGAADNSASTYDFSYGNNIFIVPTSLNGYCIDTVYIRAIGCSTCPPVAGDKDYYVGVYKANAGARVTTSGATLVGSQITMNEYDLNEVNTNYTLSTGEAWWVYLNGTYTSDMAYVTAGFIVKKTCN